MPIYRRSALCLLLSALLICAGLAPAACAESAAYTFTLIDTVYDQTWKSCGGGTPTAEGVGVASDQVELSHSVSESLAGEFDAVLAAFDAQFSAQLGASFRSPSTTYPGTSEQLPMGQSISFFFRVTTRLYSVAKAGSDVTGTLAMQTPEYAYRVIDAKNKPIKDTRKADSDQTPDAEAYPVCTITLEDGRTITALLMPEFAPETVGSFIALANAGFYDGLIFHRIIKDFVIQGGDPEGTGMGGPGYSIRGEFASNGFPQNPIRHIRGALSMARTNMPDTAGSQFFIVTGDAGFLDGEYAGFGMIEDEASLAIIDELGAVATGEGDKPLTDIKMKTVRVESFGREYPFTKLP